jgi:hypothetical protein
MIKHATVGQFNGDFTLNINGFSSISIDKSLTESIELQKWANLNKIIHDGSNSNVKILNFSQVESSLSINTGGNIYFKWNFTEIW